MSKPISQLDDVTNLGEFIVPGIQGTGPFVNVKGKITTYFVKKSGDVMTGALQLPLGTPAAPALHWGGAAGIYAPDDNQVSIVTANLARLTVGTAITTTLALRAPGNSALTPSYSFSAESNSGLYRNATGVLAMSVQGADVVQWAGATKTTSFFGPAMLAGLPTAPLEATPKQYVDAQVGTKLSDAPSDGLTYGRKNAAWATIVGGAIISDNAPAGPLISGQFWWESDSGNTYIYYNDGTSSQWVQTNLNTMSIGDNPPANPLHGQLWWDSDSGDTYLWYDDGNSAQWVQTNVGAQALTDFVKKSGDIMTGHLFINRDFPSLFLDTNVGNNHGSVRWAKAGSPRWQFQPGGDAASDFQLFRFDDAGAFIDTPLIVRRSSGLIDLPRGQLKFPVTQNPSSDVNTLDDYEEGTWVPTITFGGSSAGVTYQYQEALYTKIGKQVNFQVFISLTNNGTGVGAAVITGLPYFAASNNPIGGFTAVNYSNFAGLTGSVFGYVTQGGTTLALSNHGGASGIFGLGDTNVTNTALMYLVGQYIAAN